SSLRPRSPPAPKARTTAGTRGCEICPFDPQGARPYRRGSMRVAALLVLLALPASAGAQKYGGAPRAAALAPIEKQMAAAVRQAWPKADVAVDAALTIAAEDLARSIADGMALADAARPETVRLALARAGAVAP